MIDDGVITGKVLLQHMQGMRSDLQTQIDRLDKRMDRGFEKMDQGFARMAQGFARMEHRMEQGFSEAEEHRVALQEDLCETMRIQAKHGRKLARVKVRA